MRKVLYIPKGNFRPASCGYYWYLRSLSHLDGPWWTMMDLPFLPRNYHQKNVWNGWKPWANPRVAWAVCQRGALGAPVLDRPKGDARQRSDQVGLRSVEKVWKNPRKVGVVASIVLFEARHCGFVRCAKIGYFEQIYVDSKWFKSRLTPFRSSRFMSFPSRSL